MNTFILLTDNQQVHQPKDILQKKLKTLFKPDIYFFLNNVYDNYLFDTIQIDNKYAMLRITK